MQQVHRLAERLRDRSSPVRAGQIRHRAPQERYVVLDVDGDVARKLLLQLTLYGREPAHRGSDSEIEYEPVSALLPQNQAGLTGGLPVDEHLARRDGQGLSQIAVGHRDALDSDGIVHNQVLDSHTAGSL